MLVTTVLYSVLAAEDMTMRASRRHPRGRRKRIGVRGASDGKHEARTVPGTV